MNLVNVLYLMLELVKEVTILHITIIGLTIQTQDIQE